MNRKYDTQYNFIYLTINTINNKGYVGFHSTNNLNDGYLGSGVLLNKKINQYGKEKFVVKILENVDLSNWKEKEQYWIKEINTLVPNGYNLTIGGDGGRTSDKFTNKGKKHSAETKKKISLSEKGKINSEETRKRMSISKKGKPRSVETIEKIRSANTGKKRTAEQIKNISESLKGNPNLGNNLRNRPIKKCPYCSKEMDISNYAKYHGEKCKLKER